MLYKLSVVEHGCNPSTQQAVSSRPTWAKTLSQKKLFLSVPIWLYHSIHRPLEAVVHRSICVKVTDLYGVGL